MSYRFTSPDAQTAINAFANSDFAHRTPYKASMTELDFKIILWLAPKGRKAEAAYLASLNF